MQRGLRMITLQDAIEKSTILLSQYWKFEWLDGTIIISYFGGSNIILPTVSPSLTKSQNDKEMVKGWKNKMMWWKL